MDEKKLERRLIALEKVAHKPQNYTKQCEEMRKRIKVLETKLDYQEQMQKSRDHD